MPAGKRNYLGVWEGGEFIGAVVFALGCRPVGPWVKIGVGRWEGCELALVALRRHETPVTRILSISLKLLQRKNPGLRLVVSFADPAEGHHGGIYQAGNWIYTGRSAPQHYKIVNGERVHSRTWGEWRSRGQMTREQWESLPSLTTPGKFRYFMPLDKEARELLQPFRKPYPPAVVPRGAASEA